MHTVQLANLGTPGDKLSLNYFTVYVPDGTSFNSSASMSPNNTSTTASHSHTNVGVIVGPTIAGVVVLCAIVGALWFWLRSRPHSDPSPSPSPDPASSVEDAEPIQQDPSMTPFPRNVRPDVWVKGAEAGHPPPEMQIQVVSPVVPYQGKRQAPGTLPPTQRHAPSASVSSLSEYTSHTGLDRSQLGTAPSAYSVSRSSSTAHLNSAPASQMSQVVNVDQIIELIAQRIDPGGSSSARDRDPEAPPPQYAG